MAKTVKVCVALPTMGYTHAESYCNRLVNFMHLGHLDQQGRLLNALKESLLKETDEATAIKVLNGVAERTHIYWSKDATRFEFWFAVIGRIFTPFAREQAAKMALKNGCDYLYMIDDDMICPDDMFETLYTHNVDIVAPLAFTRNYPHKPVMYFSVDKWDAVNRVPYHTNGVVWNYPKNKLSECDAVGFGAVLIKMDVIRKMKEPYFMSTCGTGEDILFCYKAKEVGARVFMDTSCKIGHLGAPLNVTEEYVTEQRSKDVKDFDKVHTPFEYEPKVGEHPAVFVTGE